MGPDNFSNELPIKPFEFHEQNNEEIDPISLRLQELHDALDDDSTTFAELLTGDFNLSDIGSDLPPPPPEILTQSQTCAKYLSNENIPEEHLAKKERSDTIPRPSKNQGQGVLMRRSSSVPCKVTHSDRGSTSSSDSGFSPGSPKPELTA